MLGATFQAVMGPSSDPQVLLFNRFQSQWKQIDQSSSQPSVIHLWSSTLPRSPMSYRLSVQHIWRPPNHEMTTGSSLSSPSSSWEVSQHVVYVSWNRGRCTSALDEQGPILSSKYGSSETK